ncbi:MAG: L,D-transpeptidase [Hyphomicrobiales bacterium]
MNTDRRGFLGLAGAGLASLVAAPAAQAQLVNKYAEDLKNGEFNWFPDRSPAGPMVVIVSIPDQRVYVYRNGIRVASSSCSTGKPGHETPTGVFKILQKDKNHRSSTYNNAPMPNMNRLTWSGIALHAGQLPGYPASHGCVRLPIQFSSMLFGITRLGMTVVIADARTFPMDVVHPGMVLGNYARQEFGAVDAALMQSAYSERQIAQPRQTSVVVSAPDRKIRVFENDRLVASGKVTIRDDRQPVANSAYVLHGYDPAKQELRWSTAGFGKTAREDTAARLQRFQADNKVREEIRKRMHQGMTVVTTDQRSSNATRSKSNFVVIDGLY